MGVAETTANDVFAMLSSATGSPDYRRMMARFRSCRTEELGGRILRCPNCDISIVEYNRCNSRGCPRCAPDRQREWRIRTTKRLLPTGHFHITFSGPASLRLVWLADKRRLINELFAAASTTVSQFAKTTKLTFGFLLVFHSHGRGLSYKPHIHCLLTPGGVDDKQQWRQYTAIPENKLATAFRSHFLHRLSSFDGQPAQKLIAEETPEDWNVYAIFHPESGTAVVDYFSRSLFGSLIDPRLAHRVEGNTVTVCETHDHLLTETTLSRDEFIRRYFAHIPPPGATTIRYYGLYSSRMAALHELLRAKLRPLTPQTADSQQQHSDDPHPECPECHCAMVVRLTFTGDEPPPVLQLYRKIRGSPCPHQHRFSPIDSRRSA